MIKKRNVFKKLGLLAFSFACAIFAFIVPSYAYSEDNSGNLVSDNLVNYKEINSSKFTDLGNNSFKLNWGGSVSTITLPYSSFEANTQYSLTITKISGANYWAFQFYWNYADNTSERFTNNQGVSYGTYSYTSALNKTLLSITIVLNYEADFKDLMLNKGNPKPFEPYGKTYYNERYITDASVLDYTNIAKAYFSHPYGNFSNPSKAYTAFIYNGKYGYLWDAYNLFDWNDFEYVVNGSDTYIKDKIYSNYGSLYKTEWNAWDLITLGGTSTGHYTAIDTIATTLTYEFITPVNLINIGFDFASFDYINFYDSRGNMLGSVSKNDNVAVSYNNVSKIVGERKISDLPEDTLYIVSSLSSGYYDFGYKDGYNKGYNEGLKDGEEESFSIGYQEGYREGKIDGHDEGYNEALGEDLTTRGFWGLLNSIFSYPVNMIKSVFNFEFMGINIASLITFVISLVIVALIVRKFTK